MMDIFNERRKKVAILGAGSWGTALAQVIAENGHVVTLWDRNERIVGQIQADHVNSVYLPGIELPASVAAVSSMRDAVTPQTDWVVLAVSSSGIRDVVGEAAGLLSRQTALISATKGLEAETSLTMSEVAVQILKDARFAGLVVLSGPNLAQEVVRRVPTAAVAASGDLALARGAQALLMTPRTFRVYTHTDVKGVELAGALKNVLAIGAGISDGLGFGDNTKAALMTRGLSEMSQLGVAAGANLMTFLGLAGVGDLMATAASKLSRNYRVGVGIAAGKMLETILNELGQVAEGVTTAPAARLLSERYKTETPLFESIYEMIYEGKPPSDAVEELMSRPAKDEFGEVSNLMTL